MQQSGRQCRAPGWEPAGSVEGTAQQPVRWSHSRQEGPEVVRGRAGLLAAGELCGFFGSVSGALWSVTWAFVRGQPAVSGRSAVGAVFPAVGLSGSVEPLEDRAMKGSGPRRGAAEPRGLAARVQGLRSRPVLKLPAGGGEGGR